MTLRPELVRGSCGGIVSTRLDRSGRKYSVNLLLQLTNCSTSPMTWHALATSAARSLTSPRISSAMVYEPILRSTLLLLSSPSTLVTSSLVRPRQSQDRVEGQVKTWWETGQRGAVQGWLYFQVCRDSFVCSWILVLLCRLVTVKPDEPRLSPELVRITSIGNCVNFYPQLSWTVHSLALSISSSPQIGTAPSRSTSSRRSIKSKALLCYIKSSVSASSRILMSRLKACALMRPAWKTGLEQITRGAALPLNINGTSRQSSIELISSSSMLPKSTLFRYEKSNRVRPVYLRLQGASDSLEELQQLSCDRGSPDTHRQDFEWNRSRRASLS